MPLLPVSIMAAAVAGVGVAHFWPFILKRLAIHRLRKFCHDHRLLCLTYDDGPGPRLTPKVCQLLAGFGVEATFFIVGRQISATSDLVDRLQAHGHELGCHTQNHFNAWKVAPWIAVKDIRAGYRSLATWISPDGIFRPPHGKPVLATWWELRQRKAPVAWWTHDSGDTYRHLPVMESVIQAVQANRGGVVLMHDNDREDANREEYVLALTERLLCLAADEALSVVKVGDVLKCIGYSA